MPKLHHLSTEVLPKIVVKFLELSVTGIFKTKNFNFFLNEYNFKDISEAPSSSVLIKGDFYSVTFYALRLEYID